ncbi:hypothetical protein AT15_08700 [Kosmotoga arenicorallina S304]|uniref:Uncharacterized protein n=1 Tax=Kosmotoga arenicorallina S304 TaxID=1453497 RepID=A0A176K1Z6_9BACT|nr:hypothetical protein [Kosmotoga arenicorallina]OAA31043.1 hypothetical protein AT15_08700 [Kosmotoga arenicorallina S304]
MKAYNLVVLCGKIVSLTRRKEETLLTLKFSKKEGQEIKVIVKKANMSTEMYKGAFVLVEAFLYAEKPEPYLLARRCLVTSTPYDYDLDIELPRLVYENFRRVFPG